MPVQPSRDRFAFLGREFLTWLWYEAERGGGTVQLESLGPVRVDFGQRLVLESGGNVREDSTVKAEAPSLAEEARTALRVGKKVSRARLLLDVGERHFELGIDAESLTLSGVKLPTLLASEDAQRLEERLHLVEEVENLIDELYMAFIRLRKDAQTWAPVREALRAWVLSGSEA